MPVNRTQLHNEIQLKASRDSEIWEKSLDYAEEVRDFWQALAPDEGDHYATGFYKHSIHIESERARHAAGTVDEMGRKIGGRFYWKHRVVTSADNAEYLEYGTPPDYDPANSKGNWWDLDGEHHWGWNTPTKAYAFAARTAAAFGGTPGS